MSISKTALWLSVIDGLLVLLASTSGILLTSIYARETLSWAVQGIGQDIVNIVAVVVLLIAVSFVTKGSVKAFKEAEARPVDVVENPGSYEAFVIGSAIYYGSWLKEATEWVRRNRVALAQHPMWLFSVGPLGTEVQDAEQQPKEMAEFQQAIKPREQRIFFGALDPSRLSFAERVMVKAVRAPEGDFRDWQAIDAWAASIARALG